jgi:cytochrome c biogenesis protein ResB
VHLKVTPVAGGPEQDVTIKRNEEVKLADGTKLRYVEFNPHFVLDRDRKVQIESGDYKNPAAHLEVTRPDGERVSAWAFSDSFIKEMEGAPFLKSMFDNQGGYRFQLVDFEKVPQAHMLSIQYDPGSTVVYAGFGLLCLTLIGVFFFSHQRLWMVVENGVVYLGGDANRNRLGFEDKLRKIAARVAGRAAPETE